MPLFPLCEDPLIKTLRKVFSANIVLVPDERIRPLGMVAQVGRKNYFRGDLAALLIDPTSLKKGPPVKTAQMADIAGKRSREVSLEVGLDILEGFLRGFGIPSAGVRTHFKGATKVSFSFNRVQRHYVDVNQLGRLLKGQAVDRSNPAAALFFDGNHPKLLVIDGVITSSDFAITVAQSVKEDFKLNVPAIQAIVSSVKPELKLASTSGLDLTFQGDRSLTFAFTCLQLMLTSTGKIKGLPPARRVPPLGITTGKAQHGYDASHPFTDSIYNRVLLYSKPGLISWDEANL